MTTNQRLAREMFWLILAVSAFALALGALPLG